jgi:cyclophilin family peptidyl-prolyl cis-trans isomerase
MRTAISRISRAGLVLAGLVVLAGCGGDDKFVVPSDADSGAAQRPQVTMVVSNGEGVSGTFVITLVPEYAPKTVANFLNYVESGFYDGTVIHRHHQNFVLQGGGYMAPVVADTMPTHKATNPAIALELKVSNVFGTVAMARTSAPNSATSEFFINIGNNVALNTSGGGYAAFGYITNMTPVASLLQAPCVSAVITQNGAYGCLPVPNLVITSATRTR